ncbi:hypothetical protein LSH36_15g18029 [Paralvinella palmiformis]|uniref:Cytochrome b5 heme-binding domain-containing protein n=1 Tax=Paralvinella palmiformis TaxID=53620 RepID=A0AAD9KCH0_9ANNE|nr:hypothetical protein LSH36_15g18029 [Paralvinella palmiformis]
MLRQLPGNTNIDHREIDDWYQTDRDTPAYAKMTDDEIVYCLTKITTHPLHQMMKVKTKCSTLIWRQKTMLTICASQRCVCYENRSPNDDESTARPGVTPGNRFRSTPRQVITADRTNVISLWERAARGQKPNRKMDCPGALSCYVSVLNRHPRRIRSLHLTWPKVGGSERIRGCATFRTRQKRVLRRSGMATMSDSLTTVQGPPHLPTISEQARVSESSGSRKNSLQHAGDHNGDELKPYTAEELGQYDGNGPDKRIMLAIRDKVYDVSSARDMYGPGAPYSKFAGRDATYSLAKFDLTAHDEPVDFDSLTKIEQDCLLNWETFYKEKYQLVGMLVRGRRKSLLMTPTRRAIKDRSNQKVRFSTTTVSYANKSHDVEQSASKTCSIL